jgi:hypothetical protein
MREGRNVKIKFGTAHRDSRRDWKLQPTGERDRSH